MCRIALGILCLIQSCILHSQTRLESGELLFCAVNSASGGSSDEVCFFLLKDLLPGTSFTLTDNGYSKTYPGLWGDTEGALKLSFNGSDTIFAGEVICWIKPIGLPTNGQLYMNGSDVTADWIQQSLGLGTLCNLSSSGDQLFALQDDSWTAHSTADSVSLDSGRLLGALSIVLDWDSGSGANFSSMPIALECGQQRLSALGPRAKYSGPADSASAAVWQARMYHPDYWTAYDSSAAYDSGGIDFFGGYRFPIGEGGSSEQRWTGLADSNWCDCRNWSGLRIPDSATDVRIDSTALRECVLIESDTARAADLSVLSAAPSLSGTLFLDGNFESDRLLEIDGKLILNGESDQCLDSLICNRLLLDKGTGKLVLKGPLTCPDSCHLLNGRIKSNDILLRIGSDTANRGWLQPGNSWTDGPVMRWFTGLNTGLASGLFPIGNELQPQYALLEYDSAASIPSSLTVRFIDSAMGSNGFPLVADSGIYSFDLVNPVSTGYWRFEAGTSGLTDGRYKLSLLARGFTEFDGLTEIGLIKRSSDTADWKLAGTGYSSNDLPDSLVFSLEGLSGFSDYGLATSGYLLNLIPFDWQLLSVEGVHRAEMSESAHAEAILEWSADGIDFSSVDRFVDRQASHRPASPGYHYYRIASGDRISDIRVLYEAEAHSEIRFDENSLRLTLPMQAPAILNWYSISGRLVASERMEGGSQFVITAIPKAARLLHLEQAGLNRVFRIPIVH